MIVVTFVCNSAADAKETECRIRSVLKATHFDFPLDALSDVQRQDYQRKMAAQGVRFEHADNIGASGLTGRSTSDHAVIEFAPPRLRPEDVTPEEYVRIGLSGIYDIVLIAANKFPVFVINNKADGTIKTSYYLSDEQRELLRKQLFEDKA